MDGPLDRVVRPGCITHARKLLGVTFSTQEADGPCAEICRFIQLVVIWTWMGASLYQMLLLVDIVAQ